MSLNWRPTHFHSWLWTKGSKVTGKILVSGSQRHRLNAWKKTSLCRGTHRATAPPSVPHVPFVARLKVTGTEENPPCSSVLFLWEISVAMGCEWVYIGVWERKERKKERRSPPLVSPQLTEMLYISIRKMTSRCSGKTHSPTLKRRWRLKEWEAKQHLVKASLLECRVWINYRSQDRTQLKPATAPACDCRILTAPRRNKLREAFMHVSTFQSFRGPDWVPARLCDSLSEDLTGFQQINIYKRVEMYYSLIWLCFCDLNRRPLSNQQWMMLFWPTSTLQKCVCVKICGFTVADCTHRPNLSLSLCPTSFHVLPSLSDVSAIMAYSEP